MKTSGLRGFSIFIMLVVASTILMDPNLAERASSVNFFQKHGLFFLFFITLFPRLTLLFSSVSTGGFIWWLGFIFCPRILVASLATVTYFHTNPILVFISWVVAIGGETAEKKGIGGRKTFVFKTYRTGPGYQYQEPPSTPNTAINKDDAIEAEFTKK